MEHFNASSYFRGYSLGAFVALINIFVLSWAFYRIFIKKAIALAVGVIVLKYAILIFILYGLVNSTNVVALVLGLSVFIPAVLGMAVKSMFFG